MVNYNDKNPDLLKTENVLKPKHIIILFSLLWHKFTKIVKEIFKITNHLIFK